MSLLKSEKPLKLWLSEYGQSHTDHTNKSIHFVCVPVIFLTIVALLYHISPILLGVIAVGVMFFYLRLSLMVFGAMLVFLALCIAISVFAPIPIWGWIGIFVLAWLGQFWGHKIEGAKPSFLEDLQFLLIGPAWVALSLMGQ